MSKAKFLGDVVTHIGKQSADVKEPVIEFYTKEAAVPAGGLTDNDTDWTESGSTLNGEPIYRHVKRPSVSKQMDAAGNWACYDAVPGQPVRRIAYFPYRPDDEPASA